MIYLNFVNSPAVIPADIRQSEVVAAFVAKYPGFPGYVYANPDQPGSSGEGMGYPGDIYGPEWKKACEAAKAAGGALIPRIGGCATHDLPIYDGQLDTLAKRLRPSPFVIGDYASGQDAQVEYTRFQRTFSANKMPFAPEANAIRTWISPDADTWICAEWFLWDHPLPASAVSGWNARRWKIADVLARVGAKVIVEINSIERHDCGFVDGVADWPGQKCEMALAYHNIDPARVIVSVRPSGMTDQQVKRLREANG